MLEGTRIVQIYVRAEGPANPRFGDEIDDDAVNDYAYAGWLPLQLSGRDEDGRQHATDVGDPWLSAPAGAPAPPDPGPAPVRITAAECSAELHERARAGLRYFIEETPDERTEPYNRNSIMEDVAERIQTELKAINEHDAAHAALHGVIDLIDHVEVSVTAIKRVQSGNGKTDPSPLNEACHRMISDFIATHHHELVAHAEQRKRESRARLRATINAGQRLGAFDD